MTVYRIKPDTNYPLLATASDAESRKVPWFNGRSIRDKWVDVEVQLVTEEGMMPSNEASDFPHFLSAGMLVCSAKAWGHLESLVANNIEVFKLNCGNCEDEVFYAVNVVRVIDCLDYSRSAISYRPSGRMKRPVPMFLRSECFGEEPIFKIPEWAITDIFVTDAFKDVVEQNELIGLTFTKIME